MKSRVRLLVLALVVMLLPVLAACASNSGSEDGGNNAAQAGDKIQIKWSTWGNPGELGRFQEFTDNYNETHPGVEVELLPIPGEYDQKILTQLSGGTAPDAFYAGDAFVVKLIENGTIEELTPYLEGSEISADKFFDGLWGAARQNEQIFGIPVDNNPMILWYNKAVLAEAGISEMPADLYERNEWTWDAFKAMTEQIKESGKYGYVLENSWPHYYSFVTSNGGAVYDEEGNFIAHENEQAMQAFQFLNDNMKAGNITFAGTLPTGQGADAMFMSNQVGFVGAGRWFLPIFKQHEGLEYDIVPWPTNTGNQIEPAGIPTAYMVMNKDTEHKAEVFAFIEAFNSQEGQVFRLSGGGNAVPSIMGADEVVSEGNLPEHSQYFLDAREVGYALWPAESGIPGLSTDITSELEALWVSDGDLVETMNRIGEIANQKIAEYKANQ